MSSPYVQNAGAYYVSQNMQSTSGPSSSRNVMKTVGYVIAGIVSAILITFVVLLMTGSFDSSPKEDWSKTPSPSRTPAPSTPAKRQVLSIDFAHLTRQQVHIKFENTSGQSIYIKSMTAKVKFHGEQIGNRTYYGVALNAYEHKFWSFGVDISDDLVDDIQGMSRVRVQIDFEADVEGAGHQRCSYDQKVPVN